MHLTALVDFDKYETWNLKLDQNPVKNGKPQPMLMNVSWKNIDRAVPYVGWLSSASGDAKLALVEGQQNIFVATAVSAHDKGMLPAGQYQAQLNLKNNNLNVPSFSYIAQQGALKGSAVVQLPDDKRMLKWNAQLYADHFNPQSIACSRTYRCFKWSSKSQWLCQAKSANYSLRCS